MQYPKITRVFLTLTHRCNLACKYCFVKQEALDMPLQVALDSIDFVINSLASEKDSASIVFFGGEPLLRWDDIIVPAVLYKEQKYPNKQCRFSITTNCVLLTEDKIRFMKEHNIGILTSIDGAKDTQDFNRPFHNGKGSFDTVETNLKLYRDIVGLDRLCFRSTVYPQTCQYLYKNYLYAIEFGYKAIFFAVDSFSDWSADKEAIVREEFNKIANHYINYWKTYKKAPIFIKSLMNDMTSTVTDVERHYKGQPSIRKAKTIKCGYGQNSSAAISPTGDLYGCQELTSNEGKDSIFYIGNIYDGVIDEKRVQLKEIFDSTSPKGDIPCEECRANVICNGGCVANNYIDNKDFNHASHGYCLYTRLAYDINAKIYRALRGMPEFMDFIKSLQKKPSKSCGNCQLCQNNEK